jgi:hypothetical protein
MEGYFKVIGSDRWRIERGAISMEEQNNRNENSGRILTINLWDSKLSAIKRAWSRLCVSFIKVVNDSRIIYSREVLSKYCKQRAIIVSGRRVGALGINDIAESSLLMSFFARNQCS